MHKCEWRGDVWVVYRWWMCQAVDTFGWLRPRLPIQGTLDMKEQDSCEQGWGEQLRSLQSLETST